MIASEIEKLYETFEEFCDVTEKYDIYWDEDIVNMIEDAEERTFEVDAGISKIVIYPQDSNYVIKVPIECIDDDGYIVDYCEREVELYKLAKERGFDCLLAKTEFLGNIMGRRVYAQERVELDSEREEIDYSNPSSRRVGICDSLSQAIIDAYGEDFYDNFVAFCSNNFINDLHEGNFAIVNGKPIIFDYSGYEGD